MQRIGIRTAALVLAAIIASPVVGVAQTAAERATTQAQTAVSAQIIRQEPGTGLSVRFNGDARSETLSTSSMRVRGTGTAMRNNLNGQARPFSYDTTVNTRTNAVSAAQYAWRGAWYADAVTPVAAPAANGLTGMYRLNTVRSDNTETIADRVTSTLPPGQRNRQRNTIMQRLASPETLALDRSGRTVTMASTLAREVSFEADGRQQVEQGRQGQTIRSSATLTGERLVVMTSGDRALDYQVTFEPIDAGRSLRVTRRINSEGLRQQVVATSIYDRTTDQLAFDLFTPRERNRGNNVPRGTSGVVPAGVLDGTVLVATLNEALSTRQAAAEDRFTMTVQSPAQYAGAVVEGHLTEVARSGRITGRADMRFDFDTIRLNNTNRTDVFEGNIQGVRAANGDAIRIDAEGQVQDDASQTDRTVLSSGIGAGIGAIIGAIGGGGRAAAIGAAIGAGAGAGSVYITGRNDLDLAAGTEFTVRTMNGQ
jgi:hypothetical protein